MSFMKIKYTPFGKPIFFFNVREPNNNKKKHFYIPQECTRIKTLSVNDSIFTGAYLFWLIVWLTSEAYTWPCRHAFSMFCVEIKVE